MIYLGAGNDEDGVEDSAVMNNIITDIKEGFVQRRLPDGGFKVEINMKKISQVMLGILVIQECTL